MISIISALRVSLVTNEGIVCYADGKKVCYDYDFKDMTGVCFARMAAESIVVIGLKTGFSIEIDGSRGADKEIGLCYMNYLDKVFPDTHAVAI